MALHAKQVATLSEPLPPTTESVILAALRSGDLQRAVELLLETFQDDVYTYCARLVGLSHAASVYERVLALAVEDLQTREVQCSLRAWIYALARKVIAAQHRTDRRHFPDALAPGYAPAAGPDPLPASRPGEVALGRALAALSPAVREVLQLIYWHGLRPAEVAHVVERSVADVRAMATSGLSLVALVLQQGSDSPS